VLVCQRAHGKHASFICLTLYRREGVETKEVSTIKIYSIIYCANVFASEPATAGERADFGFRLVCLRVCVVYLIY